MHEQQFRNMHLAGFTCDRGDLIGEWELAMTKLGKKLGGGVQKKNGFKLT